MKLSHMISKLDLLSVDSEALEVSEASEDLVDLVVVAADVLVVSGMEVVSLGQYLDSHLSVQAMPSSCRHPGKGLEVAITDNIFLKKLIIAMCVRLISLQYIYDLKKQDHKMIVCLCLYPGFVCEPSL